MPSIVTRVNAKEKVEKYFEDPSNELAKKGFEGAKNWAVENDIKEVCL
jgi:hypothetical protein